LINIIVAILLTLYLFLTLPAFQGTDPGVFPEWTQHIEAGAQTLYVLADLVFQDSRM
jgi:hypothetical protein